MWNICVLFFLISAFGNGLHCEAASDIKVIPSADIPHYEEVYYETEVPDTFDLAERAELAINAIIGCVDQKKDYSVYMRINLEKDRTIKMWHEALLPGKLMEALGLARIITGSHLGIEVDKKWCERFVDWFRNRGLMLSGADGGRLLNWIAINYVCEANERWKEIGEEAVLRLLRESVDRGEFCYLLKMPGVYGVIGQREDMPMGWEAAFHGWILQGVSQFYRATDSPDAKKLARGLAYYLKDHAEVFNRSGRFIALHYFTNQPALNFHHCSNALEGIMEYSLATGDKDLASFVKMGYEWARSTGSPLIGYFPEYINQWPDSRIFEDSETCCIADMIQIAIGLTEMGVCDYWDDVDRYLRNQFAENQLPMYKENGERYWWSKVAGAFASWSLPNEFNTPSNIWTTFTTCCTSNAVRALHRVWDKMISCRDGRLQLNLLLNRSSHWADVNSYIPYEGRVDIKIKQPLKEISIRAPEWIKTGSNEITCRVNNEPRKVKWAKRYLNLGPVKEGDTVVMSFPITERTIKEIIGKVDGRAVEYSFVIRGNNVVEISPPGRSEPHYYEKGKSYRTGRVQWKEVRRFVPEN